MDIKYYFISKEEIGDKKTKYFQFKKIASLTLNSPCLNAEKEFEKPEPNVITEKIIFGTGITENVLV